MMRDIRIGGLKINMLMILSYNLNAKNNMAKIRVMEVAEAYVNKLCDATKEPIL